MNNKSFFGYGRMKPSAGSSSSTGIGVKKGAWTPEEDMRLKNYIEKNGEGKWHLIPLNAGLNRCRKSCRLRWLNYLSPNIKRGDFGEDEVDLIKRLHKLLGNRWSLIAGRIPGRTGNDVKNFWNTYVQRRSKTQKDEPRPTIDESSQKQGTCNVIKPHVHKISNSLSIAGHNPLPIAAHDDGHLIRSLGDGVGHDFDHGVSDDDMIKEYFDGSIDDQAINEVDDKVGPFDCSPLNGDAFNITQQEDGRTSLFEFTINDVTWDNILDS